MGENDFRKSFSPKPACLVATENDFLLTEIFPFDPEMILHSHFHFKSFPGHAKHRESERKNAKHNTQRARERTRAPFQPPRAPIQPRARESVRAPIDPATESSDPANKREKERELRSSHRHRSTSCRSCRAQPDDHRTKRRRPTVSESSNSHRSRPTHPIQLSQSITGPATLITEPNTDSW